MVYAGKDGKKRRTLLSEPQDVIVLLHDNWDDYTYKTTFPTDCRMNGEDVEIGTIQILVEGQKTTFAYLDNLVENGWDGVFPIPDTHYISVPSGLTFYEQIEGHLGLAEAVDAAQRLHDASYLTKIQEDDDALRMMNSDGFRKSLQRERGAIKAYLDGWKVFGQRGITIGNQTFTFRSVLGGLASIDLRFDSPSPLPHDINVLIGPNGVGKSQLLRQIVDDWLQLNPDAQAQVGFGGGTPQPEPGGRRLLQPVRIVPRRHQRGQRAQGPRRLPLLRLSGADEGLDRQQARLRWSSARRRGC